MYYDTKDWIKSSKKFAERKTPKKISKIEMHPIDSTNTPFDMLGVDIVGPLPEKTEGNKYIIVFTEYLTRWPWAFPPFETLYIRTPRLPSDLDIIKPKERFVIEYRKNWEQAKNRKEKTKKQRKIWRKNN